VDLALAREVPLLRPLEDVVAARDAHAAAKRRFWLVAAAVFGDEFLDAARRR
jgi:hypothetical protein